jgi:NADH dehydrogenase [ubiquinone] 1 alpha subcomplex assembly factor 5
MINPTDGSSLLGRAGFTLTTVDVEDLTIHYPSMWDLMSDLRDMGESNAILGRKAQIGRDTLIAADAIYNGMCGTFMSRWVRYERGRDERERGRDGAKWAIWLWHRVEGSVGEAFCLKG